jgi:4-hydroxyphenylpyruvate dioxygenase-like putative hemolysin
MLDEPPRLRDGPIITPTVAKSIVGQAALQLTVMAALLGPLGETLTHHGTAVTDAAAAVADAAAGAGAAVTDAAATAAAAAVAVGVDVAPERIEQYTLVFNSFVLMQLFNQVGTSRVR